MIRIPERKSSLLYLRLTTLVLIEFTVIYGGINWLTQWRTDVHHLYFDWELAIPMLPVTIWIYASIIPLMVLPLFTLQHHQFDGLAKQLALAILIAGIVFLLYPGQIGYEPPPDLPTGIGLIRAIDYPYNVFPSLHVALSAIIILSVHRDAGFAGRIILAIWFVAIIISVILTHQHHVLDVVGAAILVWVCRRIRPQDIS
jgi:membrane-associated phospholipid phosphatase